MNLIDQLAQKPATEPKVTFKGIVTAVYPKGKNRTIWANVMFVDNQQIQRVSVPYSLWNEQTANLITPNCEVDFEIINNEVQNLKFNNNNTPTFIEEGVDMLETNFDILDIKELWATLLYRNAGTDIIALDSLIKEFYGSQKVTLFAMTTKSIIVKRDEISPALDPPSNNTAS